MFIRHTFEHAVISPANSKLSETVSARLRKGFLFVHTLWRAFFSAPALCSAVVQSLPCLFVFSFPYQSVTSVTLTWIMLKLPYLFFLCFVFIKLLENMVSIRLPVDSPCFWKRLPIGSSTFGFVLISILISTRRSRESFPSRRLLGSSMENLLGTADTDTTSHIVVTIVHNGRCLNATISKNDMLFERFASSK